MEVYTKTLDCINFIKGISTQSTIENLPCCVGKFSLHNKVFVRIKIKSIIFCDYIEICFSGGAKESISFCMEYEWPMSIKLVSYDYNSDELYISDCFYKNGFDFNTMDETEEIVFRFKMESEK